MKICRLDYNGITHYAKYGEDAFELLEGCPFAGTLSSTNNIIKKDQAKLVLPIKPTKILAVALNYEGVGGADLDQEEPQVFLKSPTCLSLNNSETVIPFKGNSWGEPELGVVIKKTAKNISEKEVDEYVLGFLPTNDITAQNIMGRDHHLPRSKSADGFCPVGDYILLDYVPEDKAIEGIHNDTLLRKGNLDNFIFGYKKLISWLSTWMTLSEGDLIMLGAPSRIRDRIFFKDGDVFTVRIEGFDDLVTKVRIGE